MSAITDRIDEIKAIRDQMIAACKTIGIKTTNMKRLADVGVALEAYEIGSSKVAKIVTTEKSVTFDFPIKSFCWVISGDRHLTSGADNTIVGMTEATVNAGIRYGGTGLRSVYIFLGSHGYVDDTWKALFTLSEDGKTLSWECTSYEEFDGPQDGDVYTVMARGG